MKKLNKIISNPESVTKAPLRLFSSYPFIFLPNSYLRWKMIIKMTLCKSGYSLY